MRTTSIISISIEPELERTINREAKKLALSRSEFVRMAIRKELEATDLLDSINCYEDEKKAGRLQKLNSLRSLSR
ncbi:MAG: ribbon-helix-helix protein, CopG family [bacterium]|nr:ribbon-helix-helix protein, CopG family [bacterium]